MAMDRRALLTAGAALGTVALAAKAATASAVAPVKGVVLHDHSYFIPAPIDDCWSAFTDPKKRAVWFGTSGGGVPLEPGAPKYIQRGVVDHPGLPAATETTTRFEATKGGTMVTQTMIGMGDPAVWRSAVNPGEGVAEMMGDLALYLRTGGGFARHTKVALPMTRQHPNDFAAATREFPGGIELLEVPAGTLGAQAGMQPGDVLIAINDVGIYAMRDIRVVMLTLGVGDQVNLAWMRGNKVMKGSGKTTVTPTKWRNGYDPAAAAKAREAEARKAGGIP